MLMWTGDVVVESLSIHSVTLGNSTELKERRISDPTLSSNSTSCFPWRRMLSSCIRRVTLTLYRHSYHHFEGTRCFSLLCEEYNHQGLLLPSSPEVMSYSHRGLSCGCSIHCHQLRSVHVTQISLRRDVVTDLQQAGRRWHQFPLWVISMRGGGGWISPIVYSGLFNQSISCVRWQLSIYLLRRYILIVVFISYESSSSMVHINISKLDQSK